MTGRTGKRLFGFIGIMGLLLCGCSSTSTPSGGNSGNSNKAPKTLHVAVIFEDALEDGWNTSFLDSWNRVIQEKPYGLTISIDHFENVALPDGQRVLQQLAQSGKYQMIIAHSTYSDSVEAVRSQFPDILWAYSGSGNKPLGGDGYWIDTFLQDADYLMGVIAGKMTKTDVIGTVAAFPYPNVNMYLNGYVAGAKSVNPNVKVKSTYLGSWYDPPKATQAANAEIAAGADFIYAESAGQLKRYALIMGRMRSATTLTRTHSLRALCPRAMCLCGTRQSRSC